MSNKGLLIFTGIAAAAGVGSYFYIRKQNQKLAEQFAPDPVTPTSGYVTSVSADNIDFPLKSGSKGAAVVELQKALGLPASDQDGIFGPQTETALMGATGSKQVADQAAFDQIIAKQSANKQVTDRHALAETLLNAAMAEKKATGTYLLEPNKNLRVNEIAKTLGLYINTKKRLTDNDYDYLAFTTYPNVRIVSVDPTGFIAMYDYGMEKYFYTNPNDWQLAG